MNCCYISVIYTAFTQMGMGGGQVSSLKSSLSATQIGWRWCLQSVQNDVVKTLHLFNCLSLCSSIFIVSKRSFVPSSLPSFCIALLVGIGPRFSTPLTAKIRASRGTRSLSVLGSLFDLYLFQHYNTLTKVVFLRYSIEPSPPPPAVRCHRCMGCWKAMTRASSPWSRRGVGGGSWDHG